MIKVLIAEDELSEAEFLETFLKKQYKNIDIVAVCHDGQTALSTAIKTEPNLMLLDIQMPLIDGLTVATECVKHLPYVKIIFLTAFGLFDYAQKAISIGCVEDYLLKPYTDECLTNSIDKVITKFSTEKKNTLISLTERIIQSPNIDQRHPVVSMAFEYIKNHFSEKITLSSLADDIGFSTGYVGKCLKTYGNKNFNELLLEQRISESVKLLVSGKYTVSEVAYKVGFSDPNYYYKCFQKQIGIQPKKYASSFICNNNQDTK